MIQVAICWTHISGYMSACWRALASRQDIHLKVLAWPTRPGGTEAAFNDSIVADLPVHLLDERQRRDMNLMTRLLSEEPPDVVVVPGWAHRPYRRLVAQPALRGSRIIMAMDTPWRGECRQRLARFRLRRLIRRVDAVAVAGERAWTYARHLGFREPQIHRGLYAYDDRMMHPVFEQRQAQADGWPKRFLFVGRYVPHKGVDVLLEAYARYRRQVEAPWPLTCCGQGPLGAAIASAPGVVDRGFVQPTDLPGVLREHGVFVLPSLYEPWGVALAEAMGSGMPAICSEACGAAVELVRPHFNGLTAATGDVASLTQSLRWMHEHEAHLSRLGKRAREHAAAFAADVWADRWQSMLQRVTDQA